MWTKNLLIRLLIIRIFLNIVVSVNSYFQTSNAVEWISPDQCLKSNLIFDTITATCTECRNPKTILSSNNNGECECKKEHQQTFDVKSWNGRLKVESKCEQCPKGYAVSFDKISCVRCVNPEGKFVESENNLQCPTCNDNEIVQQEIQAKTNQSVETRWERCVPCPDGTFPNKEKVRCVQCATMECICKMKKQLCDIPTTEFATKIRKINTGEMFQSEYLTSHMPLAEAGCQSGNQEQCQHLANMCVLQDLSRDIQNGACSLLESIRHDSQSIDPNVVPLLYYQNFEAAIEIFRENSIDATFSVQNGNVNSRLDFLAFAYALNGTFLGEYSIKEILQFCNDERQTLSVAFKFGVYFYKICQTNLNNAKIWRKWKEFLRESETVFFELFIRYNADDGKVKVHPVPILNENIVDRNHPINRIGPIQRDSRVLLTRRFFINDFQKEKGEHGKSFVRIPEHISINIHPQTMRDERIYIPYLRIRHMQILNEFPNKETFVDSEFLVEYRADSFRYDKTIEIAMATLCSASAMWAAIQAYSWGRRAGKMVVDSSTVIKFILFTAENIGDVFLIVMGSVCCWIIYAYKLQKVAIYFPLTLSQEMSFIAYIISATALKAIAVIHRYISIALVDTFFIDWERPKIDTKSTKNDIEPKTIAIKIPQTHKSQMEQKAKKEVIEKRSTAVIWRTYLIVNKWNELQNYRKIHISLQLFAMLFLIEYMGFCDWAKLEPGFDRDQTSTIMESKMSRFTIDLSFYFLLATAQWLLQVILIEKISDPFRNFIDLCSMANISVLAMTNPLRGHYIHGRSVHGMADTNMLEINRFLEREKENLCSLRGLENGSETQTFKVNMPISFREKISQITMAMNAASQRNTSAKMEVKAQVYAEVNEFLMNVINHVDTKCEYKIHESRMIEEVLGVDLSDTTKTGIFIRDNSEMAYSSAFVYNNEWTVSSFEGLLFCTISMCTKNRILAAFTTCITTKFLKIIATLCSTNNLTKSSFIDNRFVT